MLEFRFRVSGSQTHNNIKTHRFISFLFFPQKKTLLNFFQSESDFLGGFVDLDSGMELLSFSDL